MDEKTLQRKIIAYLKANNIYYIKTIVSSRRGVPDVICCSPTGKFIAIEVKGDGKPPTPLQKHNLDSINSSSGVAVCINDGDNLKAVLGALFTL